MANDDPEDWARWAKGNFPATRARDRSATATSSSPAAASAVPEDVSPIGKTAHVSGKMGPPTVWDGTNKFTREPGYNYYVTGSQGNELVVTRKSRKDMSALPEIVCRTGVNHTGGRYALHGFQVVKTKENRITEERRVDMTPSWPEVADTRKGDRRQPEVEPVEAAPAPIEMDVTAPVALSMPDILTSSFAAHASPDVGAALSEIAHVAATRQGMELLRTPNELQTMDWDELPEGADEHEERTHPKVLSLPRIDDHSALAQYARTVGQEAAAAGGDEDDHYLILNDLAQLLPGDHSTNARPANGEDATHVGPAPAFAEEPDDEPQIEVTEAAEVPRPDHQPIEVVEAEQITEEEARAARQQPEVPAPADEAPPNEEVVLPAVINVASNGLFLNSPQGLVTNDHIQALAAKEVAADAPAPTTIVVGSQRTELPPAEAVKDADLVVDATSPTVPMAAVQVSNLEHVAKSLVDPSQTLQIVVDNGPVNTPVLTTGGRRYRPSSDRRGSPGAFIALTTIVGAAACALLVFLVNTDRVSQPTQAATPVVKRVALEKPPVKAASFKEASLRETPKIEAAKPPPVQPTVPPVQIIGIALMPWENWNSGTAPESKFAMKGVTFVAVASATYSSTQGTPQVVPDSSQPEPKTLTPFPSMKKGEALQPRPMVKLSGKGSYKGNKVVALRQAMDERAWVATVVEQKGKPACEAPSIQAKNASGYYSAVTWCETWRVQKAWNFAVKHGFSVDGHKLHRISVDGGYGPQTANAFSVIDANAPAFLTALGITATGASATAAVAN